MEGEGGGREGEGGERERERERETDSPTSICSIIILRYYTVLALRLQ